MTKPRRKPQNESKGTKGRPARRNAPTGQLMASGDVLSDLRQARQALYDAVVNLPPGVDLAEPRPGKTNDRSTDAAVDAYVGKWREWHDNAIGPFNDAVRATMIGIDGTTDGPHLQWFIGTPQFGDPSFAELPRDLDFARQHMASFDIRCNRENERLAQTFKKIAPNAKPGTGPRPVRDHQALRLSLELRRSALDFCDWLRVATERVETAFLPRIEIGPEVRQGVHKLTVTLAGYPAPDAETEIDRSVARDLLRFHKGGGKPVEIANADAQAGKIRKLIPQLKTETGRLIRHGDGAYSLHKALIGRIDGRTSGIRL